MWILRKKCLLFGRFSFNILSTSFINLSLFLCNFSAFIFLFSFAPELIQRTWNQTFAAILFCSEIKSLWLVREVDLVAYIISNSHPSGYYLELPMFTSPTYCADDKLKHNTSSKIKLSLHTMVFGTDHFAAKMQNA